MPIPDLHAPLGEGGPARPGGWPHSPRPLLDDAAPAHDAALRLGSAAAEPGG
ncbi:hypothetical protein ACFQX4_16550 [Roseomonas sp. GCM10028921]